MSTSDPPALFTKRPRCDDIELDKLLAKLHRNDPITPSLVTTIAIHASTLGESICTNYKTLNSIILRHEATIRKRWLKKSPAQRRDVLLTAWPNMPEMHRPDYAEVTHMFPDAESDQDLRNALAIKNKELPSDAKVWPYVNIEDLSKPKCLLIFLNSRARNVPLVFAPTEMEFSPLGAMSACEHDPELLNYVLRCSIEPKPSEYGIVSRVNKALEEYVPNENGYDFCPHPSLQTLQIQQRILSFLVSCSKLILCDMTEHALLNSTVQDEPPSSDIELRNDIGHTTFADALMIAPYRNRGTIDFRRLRGYLSALYTNAKDHIWALREDPSYFADTFMSYADDTLETILDSKGRMDPDLDTPQYLEYNARVLIVEAYTMFSIWRELYLVLDQLENSSEDEGDLCFSSLMAALNCRSRRAYGVLTRMISAYSMSAPKMRKFYCRKTTEGVMRFSLTMENVKSIGESQMLACFQSFDWEQDADCEDGPMYHMMDHMDTILRKNKDAREIPSPRLYELVAQMSVVMECILQHSLWYDTPQARGIDHEAAHSHDEDFLGWLETLEKCQLPAYLINPTRGKLDYPHYKPRNRSNVQALRSAETNLDKFWEHIDTFFKHNTGVSQHEIIRQCLLDGGQMHRTPAWEELELATSKPSEKPEYVYQPFSRIFHNKAVQITGAFDKLSIQERVKQKTKGSVATPTAGHPITFAALPDSDTVRISFILDKRAYKVMKILFYVASSDNEELPKAVKWDEFRRAMVRIGFSAEKLQGSAWQFTPGTSLEVDRAIQFHEPHPDGDITYLMARRFGRRLQRVYGWDGSTFKLK